MNGNGRVVWLLTGMLLGLAGTGIVALNQPRPALAANDRFEDYILCTGPVGVNLRAPTDGVWLLDYRSGKLLGTVIDKSQGKIIGWAELDLVAEFGVPAKGNVHFLMTTGSVGQGRTALYVAETTTGKMGVYTLASRTDGPAGFTIQRHDQVPFRQPPPPQAN